MNHRRVTAPAPYFFYGTLMDAELLARVAGETISSSRIEPAWLAGYRRTGVIGRSYPVLMRHVGNRVEGCLIHGLGRRARTRLVAYEGANYRLTSAIVDTDREHAVPAAVFIFVGFGSGLRSDRRHWRLDQWQRRWKRRALRRAGRLRGSPEDD